MVIINVFLDLLFVLGFGSSVGGVALATIIAQGTAATGCIIYARKHVSYFQMLGKSLFFITKPVKNVCDWDFWLHFKPL